MWCTTSQHITVRVVEGILKHARVHVKQNARRIQTDLPDRMPECMVDQMIECVSVGGDESK